MRVELIAACLRETGGMPNIVWSQQKNISEIDHYSINQDH